jgi:hypothetical protein
MDQAEERLLPLCQPNNGLRTRPLKAVAKLGLRSLPRHPRWAVEVREAIERGQDHAWNATKIYPRAGNRFLEVLDSGVGG